MSIQTKKNQKIIEENSPKTEILQRLAQASVEGLAIQVAVNSVLPGAGIAFGGLKNIKNMKKVGEVMGKGAAKEGVKMLDEDGRKKQTAAEDLSEDVALEMLTRVGGQSR